MLELPTVSIQNGRAIWRPSCSDSDWSSSEKNGFGPGAGMLGALSTGMLTTAGGLLFSTDTTENFIAFDAKTGESLWHARLHGVSNAAESYSLDGRQFILIAAGDMVYAFALYE